MKVNRYKFMFISAFCIAKLMAAYTYISLSEDLDYLSLFEHYCGADFGEGGFDVLNTVHFFLFRPGCSLGAVIYFWVFVFIQLVLLVIAFGKLYKYRFKLSKLLLFAIYFSPTILFFASPPTKDGFFVSLTCIAVILIGRSYNFLLLVSAVIKPYLLGLLAFRITSGVSRYLIIAIGATFALYFGNEIIYLVVAKASYLSLDVGGFSLGSFIWTTEIVAIATLAIFSGVIPKKDIGFVLLICVLASGVSMNVASRIFVVSIFYLLVLRLHANARA